MRGSPQDHDIPSSLEYLEYLDTFEFCFCGAEKTCKMHLVHVGMGANRKDKHWEHFTALPACNRCHDLYDGRLGKESGAEAVLEKTGVNLVEYSLKLLINWLPKNQLRILRQVAHWLET